VAAGEIVAIHAVLALEMADDGLDGGSASHLTFDLRRDAALLLGRVDFELVFGRGVVAAVTGIGMEPLDGIAEKRLDLRDDAGEGVSVVGIAGQRLFSVTLHAIVYFWLMPAYIAFYTLLPEAAGGRLYSDTMGRLTFIMFLIFSLPVGLHHLFADPEHGSGFKFLQSFLTFLVVLPTLLTVFSICASMEIAGRVRGGRGLLGWIPALPWDEPMVLAVGLSLVMLGLGGFGGIINMSYAMNMMIHNTSWVTAHFHLIFGGAVVIMYFAIAYEMWPRMTGKPVRSKQSARWQLWLWFWGMLITTIPWHIAGLMGQPRRVATFDYADPLIARMGPLVVISVIGGAILLISAILLIIILIRSHFGERMAGAPLRYALAVNPPVRVPASLNGFALWNTIVFVLMAVAYGYPIGQFFFLQPHSVPAIAATSQSNF
jgi:cytochrome c oxidase subunit I